MTCSYLTQLAPHPAVNLRRGPGEQPAQAPFSERRVARTECCSVYHRLDRSNSPMGEVPRRRGSFGEPLAGSAKEEAHRSPGPDFRGHGSKDQGYARRCASRREQNR